MKRILAGVGVALGLGLIGYALLSGESDEELIRARLSELEEAIEVDGESGNPVVRGVHLKGTFAELFEKDVRTTIPELGSTHEGRADLAALAARSGAYFDVLEVDFEDVDVRIDGTKINARVSSRVVVTGVRRGQDGPRREERGVAFRFFKSDDHGWRISALRAGDAEELADEDEPGEPEE